MNMTGNRKSLGSVRRTALWVAVVVAGIVWALCLPYEAGGQSGLSGAGHRVRPSGRLPVAIVLSVSGPASAHWNGLSRPLEVGSGLEAGDVIVTGAHSTVLVRTADGGEYEIFSESQVIFRGTHRRWLDQFDRWLNGIKTQIQRLGGSQPSAPISCPTAVISVRAAIFAPTVRDVAEFEEHWLEMESEG